MTPVFAASEDPAVATHEFSVRWAAAMGTKPPNLPDAVLEERVARLRATPPPWHTGIDDAIGLPARTLVVTSGTNRLYEEVAEALVERGAEHFIVTEAGHRVQDSPITDEVLDQFWG
jgi:hypothetical protein